MSVCLYVGLYVCVSLSVWLCLSRYNFASPHGHGEAEGVMVIWEEQRVYYLRVTEKEVEGQINEVICP